MKINPVNSLKVFETPNALVTPLATKRLGSDEVSVIRQRMESGHKNPTHIQTTEEVMVMIEGEVSVTVDGETKTIVSGDTLIVSANTPHSIENTSGNSAEWLIISPLGMKFIGQNGKPISPPWAE